MGRDASQWPAASARRPARPAAVAACPVGRPGAKQATTTHARAAVPIAPRMHRRLGTLTAHLLPCTTATHRHAGPPPSRHDVDAFAGKHWNNGELLAPREITQADQGCPAIDSRKTELTKAEAEQFKSAGYIIKRGLIPAEELLPFVDRLWDEAPQCVSRDRPESWVDPPWVNTPPDRPGHGSNYQVLSADARWWWGEIGHDPEFMKATCRHPNVLGMVESLLGGPIKKPTRNRGLYTVRSMLSLCGATNSCRCVVPHRSGHVHVLSSCWVRMSIVSPRSSLQPPTSGQSVLQMDHLPSGQRPMHLCGVRVTKRSTGCRMRSSESAWTRLRPKPNRCSSLETLATPFLCDAHKFQLLHVSCVH